MKIYTLERVQQLPMSQEEAWQFFSMPHNLAKITPPEVKFETLTDLSYEQITNGLKIEYRLRPLLNIPIRWKTEIREVDAPRKFMDKQMKGPYALWEHTHTFEPWRGGTRMTDVVRYALPLGILGRLTHAVVVKKQLEHIFNFRETALVRMFGEHRNNAAMV